MMLGMKRILVEMLETVVGKPSTLDASVDHSGNEAVFLERE